MYAFFVLTIFTWLAYVISGQVTTNIQLLNSYRAKTSAYTLTVAAESLKQYYAEKQSYPTSLTSMSATVGFEQVKSYIATGQGYSVSPSIIDSVWTFQRATVFNYSPTKGDTVSSITTGNSCGSGSFSVSTSWCGPKDSLWFRNETRESFNDEIVTQRAKQQRILQKMASYFNTSEKFPNKDQSSVALVAGSSYPLKTLAGFGGTAMTCSGTFTWEAIPIDCGEMFDRWGNDVLYAYFSNTHIAIVTSTPILNKFSVRINIASDLNAT